MADSYLKDITSEAEEEMARMTIEEAADKEVDGEAKEEEQDDGAEAEEEQIPQNLHGYWAKCHVKDAHVQALENEGTVAPQAESHLRTDFKAPVPARNSTEIVMLKISRGEGSQHAAIFFLHKSLEVLWAVAPPYSPKQLGVCSGIRGLVQRIP
jgi:hypothetical protein